MSADAHASLGDTGALDTTRPLPSPLVRVANWSPDAVAIDLCLAPRGTSSWTGPVLGAALGASAGGDFTLVDTGLPFDAGASAPEGGVPPASEGVAFPRVSPYVALSPGGYDVRVVASEAASCATPIVPDTLDLPNFGAGLVATVALVGAPMPGGNALAATLALLHDDSTAPQGSVALRFINAVPSVTTMSLTTSGGSDTPQVYFAAAELGMAAVDSDAGPVDANDYLVVSPVTSAVWSLRSTDAPTTTLADVVGVALPGGTIVTLAGVGGEPGPHEADVGMLLCLESGPARAGGAARCTLYAATAGVCPSCAAGP